MEIEKELTIQEVAQISGLSEYTLRYYERIGLLDHIDRAGSGHRRYNAADLEWIQFLVFLKSTGMSIRQMQECAELRRGGDTTRRERIVFLEEHRERVLGQMQMLEKYLAFIDRKIDDLQTSLAANPQADQSVAAPAAPPAAQSATQVDRDLLKTGR